MFVDDCAFIFDTYDDTCLAAQEIHRHMKRFGLLMHVGSREGIGKDKSKTEAMFFAGNHGSTSTMHPTETINLKEQDKDGNPVRKEVPKRIQLNDEKHVHFTNEFYYLGAIFTDEISDKKEILTRLRQASNQLGALSNFFRSKADMKTKLKIFLAIPVNTALYGCESWTLTEELRRRITGFYHKGLRKIMGLNMWHVEQLHIRNEHIRNHHDLDDPLDIIRKRQFLFLGKLARMPNTRLPKKFLTAWVSKTRRASHPFHTLRNSYVETLQTVLDLPDNTGAISTWVPLACDEPGWRQLATNWQRNCRRTTLDGFGIHPLSTNTGEKSSEIAEG
jgi:hypothetical protein